MFYQARQTIPFGGVAQGGTFTVQNVDAYRLKVNGQHSLIYNGTRYTAPTDFTVAAATAGVAPNSDAVVVTWLNATSLVVGQIATLYLAIVDTITDGAADGMGSIGAGEAHLGEVGGNSLVIPQALVTDTTAYSSGDAIGGKLTFAGMARKAGGTGMAQNIIIHSKSLQTFACELWLFHTDPTASTITNNSAFDLAAADFNKVIDVIPISTWFAGGATRSVARAGNLASEYQIASGQTAGYGALVARATPTLASTSDLNLVLKVLRD